MVCLRASEHSVNTMDVKWEHELGCHRGDKQRDFKTVLDHRNSLLSPKNLVTPLLTQ